MKKLWLSIFIFLISLAAYYYPIHQKGYATGGDYLNLAEARNYAVAGTYRIESHNGVFLSADQAASSGKDAGIPNPLTSIIYGQILKHLGSEPADLLKVQLIAIILAALANVILFLTLAQLFGVGTGFVAAILMALLPSRLISADYFGSYEFAMLFFVLAVWFYLGAKNGPFRAGLFRILLASIFFALAALARNAFLISFAPFALFDFYKNRSFKRLAILVIPFALLFGSTLTSHSWLGVPNGYTADINNQPFSQLGEVFPDPYTVYYNRDTYIAGLQAQGLDRTTSHFLKQWGFQVTLGEQLKAYKESLKFYLTYAPDLINYGGPLIILLMALGAWWLYRHKKDLFWFFGLWLLIWLGGLTLFETANWDHFMEIILIAAALAGLGFYQLWRWLNHALDLTKRRQQLALGGLILLMLLAHLVYADRWRLYDTYRSSYIGTILQFSDTLKTVTDPGVIAVGVHPSFAYGLYYFNNRDMVFFNPATVEELIKNGQLKTALDRYHVKTAVGFSTAASADIKRLTGLATIPWDK